MWTGWLYGSCWRRKWQPWVPQSAWSSVLQHIVVLWAACPRRFDSGVNIGCGSCDVVELVE